MMITLPPEVIQTIYEFLPLVEAVKKSITCKLFYYCLYNNKKRREQIEFIHRNRHVTAQLIFECGKRKYKEIIDWIAQKNKNWIDWNDAMYGAASKGHKPSVQWFVNKGANDWSGGMFYASLGGHKELVKWFIQRGVNDINTLNEGMRRASFGGHKDLIKWFVKKGANDWNGGMNQASLGGHTELVKWFRSFQ